MTTLQGEKISQNFKQVLENVEKNSHISGRKASAIKVVVVTKGHSLLAVRNAIIAGIQTFGENYLQEAAEKINSLSGIENIEWHMIGHIQSRKAKLVSQKFSWIQTLDSIKLANRLNRFAAEIDRKLPVLLECNVSGEQAKFGWPAWDESRWNELCSNLARFVELPNLDIRGLMTMPPLYSDPEQARPFFIKLRKLRGFLIESFPGILWQDLSMGMSADYEVAIQEGATIIRVGTAIMGPRTKKNN